MQRFILFIAIAVLIGISVFPTPQPKPLAGSHETGPLREQLPVAPAFSLPDLEKKTVSLADYQGRPVLVIFYLGFGCVHCVEQLTLFIPRASDFERAGIAMVAISTDSIEKMRKSADAGKAEIDLPIPILADPSLRVFQAYRAFDELKQEALHGTYLIDSFGRIRWYDIGPEPFLDPDLLLKEAKRLLRQP